MSDLIHLIQQREALTRAHDFADLMRYSGTIGGIKAVGDSTNKYDTPAERIVEMVRDSIARHEQGQAAAYDEFWAKFTGLTEQIDVERAALDAEIKAAEDSAGGPR